MKGGVIVKRIYEKPKYDITAFENNENVSTSIESGVMFKSTLPNGVNKKPIGDIIEF